MAFFLGIYLKLLKKYYLKIGIFFQYHKFLHYELCYYQAIDYVLENGLRKIEAGAQGDHKLSRGYLPNFVYSLHWFLDEQFGRAVNDYLNSEGQIMSKDQKIMMEESPFRKMED